MRKALAHSEHCQRHKHGHVFIQFSVTSTVFGFVDAGCDIKGRSDGSHRPEPEALTHPKAVDPKSNKPEAVCPVLCTRVKTPAGRHPKRLFPELLET